MFCPKCGETNKGNAVSCVKCGYVMPVAEAAGPDGLKGILPTQTSGWAIAAGYLGLFSLLAVPGPLAVVCGIIALKKLRIHPEQRGHVRALIGLVLGSLGSLVLVIALCMSVMRLLMHK